MKTTLIPNRKAHDQNGLGSILVTMIIMFVLSLIVLGASQLARRGQRQTIDRQLSTQAFYAAESGVNDATEAITTDLASGGGLVGSDYTSNCSEFTTTAGLTPDLSANVKYSCLLVDPTPTTWEGTVGETSRTTPIRDKNGGPVGSVTIAWQESDGNTDLTNCTSVTNFEPVTTRACKTPILRVDLVRTDAPTRAGLIANAATTFLIPLTSGGATSLPFAPSTVATRSGISCSAATTPKICKVTFTGAGGTTLGGTGYYLRMQSIYGSSDVTVSASATNAENPKLELRDSQIVIDSTGKAVDVLRRIQVRVPFAGAANIPDFALQSGDTICKQLQVSGATAAPATADPACQP